MNIALIILIIFGSFILGAAALWLWSRNKLGNERAEHPEISAEIAARDARIEAKNEQINDLNIRLQDSQSQIFRLQEEAGAATAERARLTTLIDEERKSSEEKLKLVNGAREELSNAFKALSAEALNSNNKSFIDLAKATLEKFHDGAKTDLESRQQAIKEMVFPVRESLQKVDSKLDIFTRERVAAETELSGQLKSLALTQGDLKSETARLVRALRTPNVRGRWGEIQLKRVVEIAGMLPYCDFDEQTSKNTEEGRLRPDLLVRLPGGKNIVVDAKAPLEAYLNALESEDDEVKKSCLLTHTKQIHDHMIKLSSKAYWDQFQPTPDFVIMFLPGETFFSAALEQDPHLIEEGVNQKVILASPTTLIALLRAIAYGWQQETLAEGAQEISDLGKELFDRLCVFSEHLEKLGSSLDGAVSNYNKAVGSFDTRVLVSARRFTELGLSSNKEVPYLKQVEKAPRELTVPETGD